jgi:YHS domain-containing protein
MLAPLLALSLLAAPAAKQATNTVCPVLGNKVMPGKSPKVAVRGQEYYLCCVGCDDQLLKDPAKFINKDGTPKNAAKGDTK